MTLADAVMGAAGGDTTPIVVGGLALLSAVLVAVIGARGTFRTADTARESNFDKRLDDRMARVESENEQLKQRCEKVTAERDDYRERYVELRIAVINARLDPDEIVIKGVPGGPS